MGYIGSDKSWAMAAVTQTRSRRWYASNKYHQPTVYSISLPDLAHPGPAIKLTATDWKALLPQSEIFNFQKEWGLLISSRRCQGISIRNKTQKGPQTSALALDCILLPTDLSACSRMWSTSRGTGQADGRPCSIEVVYGQPCIRWISVGPGEQQCEGPVLPHSRHYGILCLWNRVVSGQVVLQGRLKTAGKLSSAPTRASGREGKHFQSPGNSPKVWLHNIKKNK